MYRNTYAWIYIYRSIYREVVLVPAPPCDPHSEPWQRPQESPVFGRTGGGRKEGDREKAGQVYCRHMRRSLQLPRAYREPAGPPGTGSTTCPSDRDLYMNRSVY